MDSDQIAAILTPLLGDVFGGVWPCDRLPSDIDKRPLYLVVNTDPHDKPGQHWIGIILEAEKGVASFFDSYGYPPDAVFYPKSFKAFIARNAYEIRYNRHQVQDDFSSFCGGHVIFYLCHRFKGLSYQETMRLYSDDLRKNDILVTRFVKKFRKCISRLRSAGDYKQNTCSLKLFNECHDCVK